MQRLDEREARARARARRAGRGDAAHVQRARRADRAQQQLAVGDRLAGRLDGDRGRGGALRRPTASVRSPCERRKARACTERRARGLDAGRRVRGHPLRAAPATGSRRSRSTGRRCATRSGRRRSIEHLRRARAGPRGHVDRRDRAHRRGPARVLLRRRPARARRHRLHAEGASVGALPRDRPARPDPAAAEAGRRDGRRLRGRRRPHPAPRLRPHDRRRQRALRPDRAARRLVGRRLRRRPAARPRRAEEGEGVLVPVPPVRRGAGARDGARQHGRAARPARGGDRRVVPRDARALPVRAAAARRRASTRTRTATPASSSSRTTPTSCSTAARRRRRGATPTRRSARPTSRGSRGGRERRRAALGRPHLADGRAAADAARGGRAGARRHRAGRDRGRRSSCSRSSPR